MSETPRTNECTFDVIVKRGDAHLGVEHYKDGSGDFVESDFCKKLERELNVANERIKRLEEAGDRMASILKSTREHWYSSDQCEVVAFEWKEAKEAKS